MKQLAHISLLLLSVAVAQAQGTYEAVMDFSNSPSSGIITGTAGWSFTPQITIQLTHLGCLDYVVTPQGPVDIGIWTDAGVLLSQAVVYATNSPVNQTRYVGVTPILLAAGSTYRIGAYSPSGSLFLDPVGPGYGGAVTLSSDIVLGGLAVGAPGFVFPNQSGAAGTMILAPNFRYDRIPEPGTVGLLAVAGLLLAARKRK